MTDFKFYSEYNGERHLQLHDEHTIWKIQKDFSINDYADQITLACMEMENHFKDLKVYYLGRSGRHVCVEDTPTNRRRYNDLVKYALMLEQKVVDYFNSDEYEYNYDEEEY